MSSKKNVEIIRNMFLAFEQGNIPSVLNMLSDDVEWQSPVTRVLDRDDITWTRPRQGRNEVAKFFNELAEKMRPDPFEVLGVTAQENRVVVEGRNRGFVRLTDRGYEHDWVMVFELSEEKIVSCRHYYDSEDLAVAF